MEQANQQQRLTRKEKRIQRQQNQKENKTYQEKLNFNLRPIEPLTNNQKITFEAYNNNKHLILHGIAGTGKSFVI